MEEFLDDLSNRRKIFLGTPLKIDKLIFSQDVSLIHQIIKNGWMSLRMKWII